MRWKELLMRRTFTTPQSNPISNSPKPYVLTKKRGSRVWLRFVLSYRFLSISTAMATAIMTAIAEPIMVHV